ncbi:MAG: aminotransferase class V-fold PLP-dependent enzyme [Longimicrobiales bacterium]
MNRPHSRRSFLLGLTAGAGLLPRQLAGAQGNSYPATDGSFPPVPDRGAADDEAYWELVRGSFSFSEDHVPMNAANLCPSTRAVAERVFELTLDIDQDCSFNNRRKFNALREESRTLVAAQLRVSAEEIALVRNTSEANNTINNGIALGTGDEVVIWDQNHPTNNVAWDVRAARFGAVIRRVAVPDSPGTADDLIGPFVDALSDRTRVLSLTHVSNVSGIRLPVKRLIAEAHTRDIHVHLDGAQSWGALDVNLDDLGCDSYSASSHKWFMGPKEVGVLYVKQDRIPHIWPSGVAPGWGSGAETTLEGARKFESLGQRDDAALAGLATAARFHEQIGQQEREDRILSLAKALKTGLSEQGFEMVTPMDPALSGGVCIARVAGDRSALLNGLYEEHGIAGAGTGGLRLCPHVYNTMAHVQRAVHGVAALTAGS